MTQVFPTPIAVGQADASSQPLASARPIVVEIRPEAPGFSVVLAELWQYRHLFVALVWRNVRVEFDATRLGSAWAIARPLLFTLVFVLFRGFSGANIHVDLPYALYVFTGLVLWTFLFDAATSSAGAIRLDAGLLTKVYYPRLLTPLVPVVSSLINVVIALVPLVIMMVWYGVRPGWPIVLLPIVLLQAAAFALGVGTLVSSISIENRDWERALAFVLSLGLWLSPVIYAPEMIPSLLRSLYDLNPLVGLLLAFRAAIFDGFPFPTWDWLYSLACTLIVLALGVWSFRRTETHLADKV